MSAHPNEEPSAAVVAIDSGRPSLHAVRQLLEEKPFAELSVSTISDRAGVARSGLSTSTPEYAVLAQILGEAARGSGKAHQHFAPRGADERRLSSPSEWSATHDLGSCLPG